MKILFINPFYKPYLGGIERVIEKMSHQFLSDTSVEKVGVLTTQWSFPRECHPEWKSREAIDHVQVFRVKSVFSRAPGFFQVPLVFFPPQEIREIIEEFQPDVIQWMTDKWFWCNFWSAYYARKINPQIKICWSPSFHDLSWKRQWLRPINYLLGKMTDQIILITHLEKEKFRKNYGGRKFQIIPWGVDFPVEKDSVSDNSEIKILAVGRLSRHKGQSWLIDLFSELKNLTEKDLKLILVGADEGEGVNLKKQIESLGLENSVELRGEVSDETLDRIYRESHLFVLFPEYEAFGLVFLEAMSYGLPVVTHGVGAIREVLQDQAFIVDPFSQIQAKVVLVPLIEDDLLRWEKGRQGQEFARKNFSWEKTARQFLDIYHLS